MASYSDLETKYNGFQLPRFSISIGSSISGVTEVKLDEIPIIDVTVKQSAGYEMSSCNFVIAGIFDYENSKLKKDILSTFMPGKAVDVKMGYDNADNLKGVFQGFITTIDFDFEGEGGPNITVQCLDAKAALTNIITFSNQGEMEINKVLKQILDNSCTNFVTTIKTPESAYKKEENNTEIKKGMDDYRYLTMIASIMNESFCILYDTLYFCKNLSGVNKDPVLELTWGKHLLSFQTTIDLSKQVGTVQVDGKDSGKGFFKGEAKTSWAKMPDVAKNKTIQLNDQKLTDNKQAEDMAKETLASYAAQLVKCNGKTIGIPDIKAGYTIKVSGMGKGLDRSFFMNEVTHIINGNGYITTFQGVSSSID
ncbi:MAG: hypothetical protein APF81_15380 [Desulfosporosinus sp. BRH_c37]|nr:MAG: hypothetical protein APF81_15380 [Desulfosporosinus sp. BRH_c37]